MYLFNGALEPPDDSLEKLSKALGDPRVAWRLPGVINVSADQPDPVTMRNLVSNGAADWLIVEDSNGIPVEVIVNSDLVTAGDETDPYPDLLKGHKLTVVNLARGTPDISARWLLSGSSGIPLEPLGPGRFDQSAGGSTSGGGTPPPSVPTSVQPPEDPAEPDKDEDKGKDGTGKSAAPEPQPTKARTASAEVIEALAKARRAVPTDARKGPDAGHLAGQIAAAHLDEQAALNDAMVWQAAPDSVWLAAVPESERAALAAEVLRAERVWPASPDSHLLSQVTDRQTRSQLAQELLRVKAGIPATAGLRTRQEQLEDQRIAFEQQRTQYFARLVLQADEYIEQRKKWRELADQVPKILRWALIVSAVLTAGVFGLLLAHAIDGWQAVMMIFVLAVAAISPSVLLLVERPLAGIDAFQPSVDGSKAKGSASGSEGDGASSTTGSGDDKKD